MDKQTELYPLRLDFVINGKTLKEYIETNTCFGCGRTVDKDEIKDNTFDGLCSPCREYITRELNLNATKNQNNPV